MSCASPKAVVPSSVKKPEIYAICVDGVERYIGKTEQPLKTRLCHHLSRARKGAKTHVACLLRAAMREGKEITIVWVDEVQVLEEWGAIEAAYIHAYQEEGYDLANIAPGGEGVGSGVNNPNFGVPLAPEHREKIAAAARGRKRPTFSEEWRSRLSAARKGRKMSPEQRAAMSARMVGKMPSPQFFEKARIANAGRKASAETRKKMSDAKKGVSFSPEHCAKLSAAQLGKPRGPQTPQHKKNSATGARHAGPGKSNKTGYKGVSREGNKWRAQLRDARIGIFNSPEEAARAYDIAARLLWGNDCYLNFR